EWAGLIVVGKLGEWIARGAEDAGWAPARICRCDSTDAAARALAERAQAGDGVLLKASRGARLEAILKHGIGPQGAAPAV
ncbi:MAG: hypothetical protein O3B24_09880, partial [Verrucomicrobia bacterium]|nr:hypothetical protein [Verrucomicrobiota bacterium]